MCTVQTGLLILWCLKEKHNICYNVCNLNLNLKFNLKLNLLELAWSVKSRPETG